MKKTLAILALMILVLPSAAFAWHCVDTDEDKPAWNGTAYGEWGDNGALGGATSGWHDVGVQLPEGCVQTGDYKGACEDLCVGFTLREFSCEDRPGYPRETVITWDEYEDWEECGGDEVPEFSPVALGLVVAGAGVALYISRKE